MAKWSFRPDLDHTTPNIITWMDGLVPTIRGGWRNFRQLSNELYAAGGDSTNQKLPFNGSFCAIGPGGGFAFYVCANTATLGKIYYNNGGAGLVDKSKAGSYTKDTFFTFCQFGDTTIAANKSDALQYNSVASVSAFADVSGSPPKAKICLSDANQVVLLNYNDGTDTPDGWWVSDVGTYTTWTPASTNEASNGRLTDTPGPLTAGAEHPLGGVVAFKAGACWYGVYTGKPKIRDWRLISNSVGCAWVEGAIPIDQYVYFASYRGFFRFNGAQLEPLHDGLGKKLSAALASATRVFLTYDQPNEIIYLYIASSYSAHPSEWWAYNIQTGEWGRGTGTEAIIGDFGRNKEKLSTGGSYPNAVYKTNDFTTPTHVYRVYCEGGANAGTPATSSTVDIAWTVSYQGDTSKATTVQRVVPIFIQHTGISETNSSVTYAVPTNYTKFSLAVSSYSYVPGGNASGSASATMDSAGKFDLLTSGNWHKGVYSVDINSALTYGFEWLGHAVEYVQAGRK